MGVRGRAAGPRFSAFIAVYLFIFLVPLKEPLRRLFMRRHRMSRGGSHRSFRHGAAQVHPMNTSGARYVMRGGIKL